MTEEEIDQLLAEMCVAWPNHTLTPLEARLWRSKLRPLNPEPAFAAAGALLGKTEFWPHWSEFQAAYYEQRRALRLDAEKPREIRARHLNDEEKARGRAGIEQARAQLAQSRKGDS